MKSKHLFRGVAVTVAGVALIGTGISFCVYAGYGTDPCTCLNLGVSGRTGLPFWLWSLIFNLAVLLLPVFLDRSMIGFGTVVNMTFAGIIADLLRSAYKTFLPAAADAGPVLRVPMLLLGTVVLYLGGALYIVPELGISPYDSIALLLTAHTPVKFRWCRIAVDVTCLLLGWLLGSTIGAGTVLLALAGGPLMNFFIPRFQRTLFPDAAKSILPPGTARFAPPTGAIKK